MTSVARIPIAAAAVALATLVLPAAASAQRSNMLSNLPATGDVAGDMFEGRVTISELAHDGEGGLLASGVVVGKVDGKQVRQTFTDVEAVLGTGLGAAFAHNAVCDILFLDIGPIFLDVLGLQVDLSEITLDIDAVSGPGNLLGNLLCAVAGLLDPDSGLDLGLIEDILQSILNAINQLLGGINL